MIQKILTHKSKIIFAALFITIITTVTMCCSWNPFKQNKKNDDNYWNHYLLDYTHRNYFSRGLVANDVLYTTISDGILIFDNFDNIQYFMGGIGLVPDYSFIPILSPEFAVYFGEGLFGEQRQDKISFMMYDNPNPSGGVLLTADFGEEFRNKIFSRGTFELPFGDINNQKRFVGALLPDPRDYTDNEYYIVYTDIDNSEDSPWFPPGQKIIEFTNKTVIPLTSGEGNRATIHSISAIGDKFFIAYSEYTSNPRYDILHEDGTLEKLGNQFRGRVWNFFSYDGYVLAWANRALWYSIDGYPPWNSFGTFSPAPTEFKQIDDKLFFYTYDIICFMTGGIDDYEIYQLVKGNMQGKHITSVNRWFDDLVITTSEGIFYQSFDKIMKDKRLVYSSQSKTNIINIEE